ncbi:MAG: hypothetical protein ACI8UO_001630 [Verrucomicrobiales bacterium]|jgi:hypothetical protein
MLDPDLGVSLAELAEAWDADEECRKAGEIVPAPAASAGSDRTKSFDLDLASVAVGALIGGGAKLSFDLIKTLIERALKRADETAARKRERETEVVQETDLETGLPLFKVRSK